MNTLPNRPTGSQKTSGRNSQPTKTPELVCVAMSPNGRLIAAANKAGDIHLWKTNSEKPTKILKGVGLDIHFTPDNRFLVGLGLGKVEVWDIETGRLEKKLPGECQLLFWVAISPNSRILAGENQQMGNLQRHRSFCELWHLQKASLIRRWQLDNPASGLSFSPDGETLTIIIDGAVQLWDAHTGQLITVLRNNGRVSSESVTYLQRNETLVAGNTDGTITMWNVKTGHIIGEYAIDFGRPIHRLFKSSSSEWLIALSRDAFLWRTTSHARVRIIPLEGSTFKGAGLSSDGNTLMVAKDDDIKVFETRTGKLKRIIRWK